MSSTSSTAPPHVIEFYYEAVSPYSYFALLVLQRYTQSANPIWPNTQIHLHPCQAGAIAIKAKNKTPGMVPIKGRYTVRDMVRICHQYNIPCNMYRGKDHMDIMKNSLLSTQFLAAVCQLHSDKALQISIALSARWWSQGLNFNNEEAFRAVCTASGLGDSETQKVLQQMQSDSAKQAVEKNNQTMFALGGFGVPTMMVHVDKKSVTSQVHPVNGKHVELVFGSDRLQQIAHMLQMKWDDFLPTGGRSKL